VLQWAGLGWVDENGPMVNSGQIMNSVNAAQLTGMVGGLV